MIHHIFSIFFAGVIACLAMDVWQQVLKKLTGIAPSDWAIAGRWLLCSFASKNMYQPTIASQPTRPHELKAGWLMHYIVGIIYAVVFWLLMYVNNILSATLLDGLLFGAISVVVPWFYMMPCTGKGIMAYRTSTQFKACALALATHLIFGVAMALAFSLMQ